MTVKEIVMEYLKAHGYDGLYHAGGCACLLKDPMPCGAIAPDCKAGYQQKEKGEDGEFLVGEKKEVQK